MKEMKKNPHLIELFWLWLHVKQALGVNKNEGSNSRNFSGGEQPETSNIVYTFKQISIVLNYTNYYTGSM